MSPEAERLDAADSFGFAADLLFRNLLQGVISMARYALGQTAGEGLITAVERFELVRSLSLEVDSHGAPGLGGLVAASAFAGPHHLAGLLLRTAGTLHASALVRTPAPSGANPVSWARWLRGEAHRWPFIWENHRRAIATGYLNRGESLVITSPTGSGKTTLAALKIVATILSRKTVLYLAPTHALVGQVERDLTERIGGLAKAESVDETMIEDILSTLPTLAVVTPEGCFALLTFTPELFANVGLLVFDECHLLGISAPGEITTPQRVDRRNLDAMLCLLTFMAANRNADLLLLSAMVSNGSEVADWLQTLTGRPVHAFNDEWKPTRQLRCCVICDRRELTSALKAANAPRPSRGVKAEAPNVAAVSYGLFSLIPG
jgi:DEAD/DEAH box helicase